MRHLKNDEISPGTINPDYDILNWDTTRYTDWQKELLGGISRITNIQMSVSGGNPNTQFSIGSGYYKKALSFLVTSSTDNILRDLTSHTYQRIKN